MLCQPLLFCLQSLPVSEYFPMIQLCIRWPKYWSFSFSNNPSNEYSGLISFRVNSFDLLAVQMILKSLLQHQNLNALVLQLSAFFMIHISHLCITTRTTKMMSLLFNTQSRFVKDLLPRSVSNFMDSDTIHFNFGA